MHQRPAYGYSVLKVPLLLLPIYKANDTNNPGPFVAENRIFAGDLSFVVSLRRQALPHLAAISNRQDERNNFKRWPWHVGLA